MAGYGPPPKDPARRLRGNKPTVALRMIEAERVQPYDLPEDLLPFDHETLEREDWHPATLRWWKRWRDSPLAENLTAVDWSELEATAVLHHEYMRKRSFTLASELRLRMAAFGATPADRMRLRILVSDADVKDSAGTAASLVSSSRSRRGPLKAVGE